ncbi:MAG TPA: endolytic transglycosylase MltG [Chitinophagaceae bacterium]|nr:endolytic transglycosylase MltG [Chitinophagaceae bacterium]
MKKIFGLLFIVLVVIGGFIGYTLYKPSVSNKEGTFFYITDNDNLTTVKEKLVAGKFIKGDGFDLTCKILRFKEPKPGRYKLKDGMSLLKLVRKLRSGDQELVKMTIVKERTKELLAGKFHKKFDTQPDSLQMMAFLGSNDSLEKYEVDTSTVMAVVMPYTYEVKWNTTPGRIFQQFYTAWQKFWTEERKAKAAALQLTPLEVSTLASIVEEETNKTDDRMNVASTYINRLKQGMRLQADPTVKFITRNFQLGRITGAHLKLESPYNTYLHAGLPPGPICTPSIESLDAVLNAPVTDYLFFVASYKFDGSTVFTSNLDDHNKFVRLFHAEQNRRADSIRKLRENQLPK